jgi:hypothetical protein
MANDTFDPKKVPMHIEKPHDTIDVNKVPLGLPPPLLGFATRQAAGVEGDSVLEAQPGILATHSGSGDALFADTTTGTAVHGRSGHLAGLFEGDVQVTGNINLTGPSSDITLRNEDCAEQFDVATDAASLPGMVMVINDQGLLRPSSSEYDTRVAGVVSGAGEFRSAMTLGVRESPYRRAPLAMFGKVSCLVDAGQRPIHVGDLLTTSSVEGHAMSAADPVRAFGTVIGKALEPLVSGRGLIPILVALQ